MEKCPLQAFAKSQIPQHKLKRRQRVFGFETSYIYRAIRIARQAKTEVIEAIDEACSVVIVITQAKLFFQQPYSLLLQCKSCSDFEHESRIV